MRIESLYQYIVPLVFIAIWALTSLFHRESQPLPPRTGRVPGPRPQPQPSPDRRAELSSRDPLFSRPLEPGSQGPPHRPGGRRDDILIIEAEPRRSSGSTPRPGSPAPAPRREAKGRQGTQKPGSSPGRPAETDRSRSLSASMTHPETPPTIQSQALKPLTLPASPLLTTPNDEAAKTQAGRVLVSELDSFSSAEIRLLVQTPARLREGFILGELLKPPVALRGGLFTRRRPSGS